MSAQAIDTKLQMSDTPTQIRRHAKTAAYWGEERRRHDNIRCLTLQPRSAS